MVWEIDENDANQVLDKGLVFTDPVMVKKAIELGADINEVKGSYGSPYHPLRKLMTEKSFLYSSSRYLTPDEKKREKNDQIIDLILQESLDVHKRDDNNCNYMDHLLVAYEQEPAAMIDNLAKAFISTIHDAAIVGNTAYQINYAGIMSGLGNAPHHTIRSQTMDNIKATLNRVRERLSDPQTEKERRLVADFPEVVHKWMTPQQLPDPANLPAPSQAYVDAMDEAMESMKKVAETFRPASRGFDDLLFPVRSRASFDPEVAREALNAAKSALERAKIESVISQYEPPPAKADGPV